MSRKRRILLINPQMCSPRAIRLPLSLLALGAVLDRDFSYEIIDGNVDADATGTAIQFLDRDPDAVVGISVMPGPQVATSIATSMAIREAHPRTPIVWGGYFPTMYPDCAINADYVDYVVRGQGEGTFLELLERLADAGSPRPPFDSASDPSAVEEVAGITWKSNGTVRHNADRPFRHPDAYPPLPYERAGNVARYLRPSFMGSRTGVHQAAIGCRYHCGFCGVVTMFNGVTELQGPERLLQAATTLRDEYGATAMQYYDNNFFDTEEASIPLLEALGKVQLPWWCYARADTLANFSTSTWDLIRRSRLRMAYIGAESSSDEVLLEMKKGSRVEHTFEVARLCFENDVVPEFSFVLGGPTDPEGEVEKTLSFIKKIKKIHPHCEVILYFYSPTPRRQEASQETRSTGLRLPVMNQYGPEGPAMPMTPEEWTQPRWLDYVCHQDAPWLTPATRSRVKDFSRVLACRFPTVQDYHSPAWAKAILKIVASWRYATGRYDNPWDLDRVESWLPLRQPQRESL